MKILTVTSAPPPAHHQLRFRPSTIPSVVQTRPANLRAFAHAVCAASRFPMLGFFHQFLKCLPSISRPKIGPPAFSITLPCLSVTEHTLKFESLVHLWVFMFPVCLFPQLSPIRGEGLGIFILQLPSINGQVLFLRDFDSLVLLVCHMDTVGTGGQRRPSGRVPRASIWE